MSDVTGYLIAAYVIAFVTIIGYAVVVIAGGRAAARRLDEARARHERPDDTSPAKVTGTHNEEAAHV